MPTAEELCAQLPQTTAMPPALDPTLQLSAATWLRVDGNALAARMVVPVWSRLAELQYAGHDPGVLAALRYVLVVHQPTRAGTCRGCRRRPAGGAHGGRV